MCESDKKHARANHELVKQTSRILLAIETIQSVLVFLAAIAGIIGVLIWVSEGDKRGEERILRRMDTSSLAQSIVNEMPQDWAAYQAGNGPGAQEQALALKAGLFVRSKFSIKSVAIEADCGGDDALSGNLAFSGAQISLYDCLIEDLSIEARLSNLGGGVSFIALHNVGVRNLKISDVGNVERVTLNEGFFEGFDLDIQGLDTQLEFYGATLKDATLNTFDAAQRNQFTLKSGVYEVVMSAKEFSEKHCQRVGKGTAPIKWVCKP